MRHMFLAIATITFASVAHAGGVGSTYVDASGDIFDSNLSNIDILNATFSNDATNLYLSVAVNADVATTDWGKYLVFIDSTPSIGAFSGLNGNDPFNNPWNRRVGSPAGIDAFVGSWIDGKKKARIAKVFVQLLPTHTGLHGHGEVLRVDF